MSEFSSFFLKYPKYILKLLILLIKVIEDSLKNFSFSGLIASSIFLISVSEGIVNIKKR